MPLDCAASRVLHLHVCAVKRNSVSHTDINACLVYITCQTRYEHSDITVVRKISADLVGLNDSQKHGTNSHLSRGNISYVNKKCKVSVNLTGLCSV